MVRYSARAAPSPHPPSARGSAGRSAQHQQFVKASLRHPRCTGPAQLGEIPPWRFARLCSSLGAACPSVQLAQLPRDAGVQRSAPNLRALEAAGDVGSLEKRCKRHEKPTCLASSHQSKFRILQQPRNVKLNNSIVRRCCCQWRRQILHFPQVQFEPICSWFPPSVTCHEIRIVIQRQPATPASLCGAAWTRRSHSSPHTLLPCRHEKNGKSRPTNPSQSFPCCTLLLWQSPPVFCLPKATAGFFFCRWEYIQEMCLLISHKSTINLSLDIALKKYCDFKSYFVLKLLQAKKIIKKKIASTGG